MASGNAAPMDQFDATVEEYHRALDAFVTGNADLLHAMYSRSDYVTIANPFGPPQRGWSAVRETTAGSASHFADGRALGFDHVSRCVTPELAYLVELERYEAKVGGSDDLTPVSVRVTTALRREGDRWKVVHRHADPITTAQPAESVIEK